MKKLLLITSIVMISLTGHASNCDKKDSMFETLVDFSNSVIEAAYSWFGASSLPETLALKTPAKRQIRMPKAEILEYNLKVQLINESKQMRLAVSLALPQSEYLLQNADAMRSDVCKKLAAEYANGRLRVRPASQTDRTCDAERESILRKLTDYKHLSAPGSSDVKVKIGQNSDDDLHFGTRLAIMYSGELTGHFGYGGHPIKSAPTGTFTFVGAELGVRAPNYDVYSAFNERIHALKAKGHSWFLRQHYEGVRHDYFEDQDFKIIIERTVDDTKREIDLKVRLVDIPTVNLSKL